MATKTSRYSSFCGASVEVPSAADLQGVVEEQSEALADLGMAVGGVEASLKENTKVVKGNVVGLNERIMEPVKWLRLKQALLVLISFSLAKAASDTDRCSLVVISIKDFHLLVFQGVYCLQARPPSMKFSTAFFALVLATVVSAGPLEEKRVGSDWERGVGTDWKRGVGTDWKRGLGTDWKREVGPDSERGLGTDWKRDEGVQA
ncbi:hypothetical protein FA95DRAFT_1681041 [Auriscalpium vulgare]|uniref:Uncharacterized protein n=1 Tax=Auriscalpium vulgare TaxID=40419 RepID=A0ACB8RK63_9AGAM|nr:hypothetical protein FA95DRAFT_1681041 [Auriscalpium vulgare]